MKNFTQKALRLCISCCTAISAVGLFTAQIFAEEATAESGKQVSVAGQLLTSILPFGIALLLLYLILLRPQQKRDKQAQEMRENVRVGDEICTAGGLVGIVIRITEDTVVLETAGERSKIRVKKWAIHENITQMEEKEAAEKARKAARQKGVIPAAAQPDDSQKKKDEKKN